MSRKPIDGNKDMYIDSDGKVLDEYFRVVKPKKNDNGDLFVKVAGQQRLLKNLVFSHFANGGKGANIRKGESPSFKDGDTENCALDNLVIEKSKEEKSKEVLKTAETDDEEEKQIIQLFIDDPDATYNDIEKRMKEQRDSKVSRNQIADAKKAWKKAVKEAGQA